ncbi:peptide chain release factor N(5)-glutamine methyltransferase [Micrococcus luteus]|nr:peptide chain release factor N(5)-glutamine methyltransferase [Micrococcus luteus]
MSAPAWSALLRDAAARLTAVGIDSPRVDAELLLAHVLGLDRGALLARVFAGAVAEPAQAAAFEALVGRRAAREPVQHLTGVAHFHGLDLAVGPGVFVPRPETELLVETVVADLAARPAAGAVVDLCTGSGAIAAAVAAWGEARGRPLAVTAVELDPAAADWARRNLAPRGVDLRQGEALVACPDLEGRVDVVVSNPPYVPEAEVPAQPEARLDPARALYGGDAPGLRIPRAIAHRAADLLVPGGLFAMEHHETQGPALLAALGADRRFTGVRVHQDLTGRDRFLTARRSCDAVAGAEVEE